MTGEIPDELSRYRRIIRLAMGPASGFTPEAEIRSGIEVERGMVFVRALAGANGMELNRLIDQLVAMDIGGRLPTIVDRAGHSRAAYPGLLVYCWAQAFRLSAAKDVEHWRKPLLAWCAVLEEQTSPLAFDSSGVPAAHGAAVSGFAWNAMALYVAGKCFENRRWASLAPEFFRALSAHQQDGGAMLNAQRSDNPETRWYHELVLLHAASSYAAQSGDERITAAVLHAAEYHLNESQPDHASSQPWGLLAFIWKKDARMLADQVLHSIRIQQPTGADGISSMLLADCLYCLPFIA